MINNFIENISLIVNNVEKNIAFQHNNYEVLLSSFLENNELSFDIKIEFATAIKQVRLPSYSWGSINNETIIPEYSNKILQLENGLYIQSETPIGIWQLSKNEPKILYWRFNPKGAYQIVKYNGEHNYKQTEDATVEFLKGFPLKLFCSLEGAIEISRSKIPFSSIMCFTDHCDFDTLELLEKQRVFFKEKNIKTTKGFFLNHFSKREDNASWENDSEELNKWVKDGHELCYHSLSQSVKSLDESFNDFKSFVPPITIPTWIDHGYQPYNLSLFEKEGLSEIDYSKVLENKNIEILWNYIDSGTSTKSVINQLNTNDFTLNSFYKGIKNKSFKTRVSLLIKNCIVHFYNDEKLIRNYTQLATSFKKVAKTKSVKDFVQFIKMSFNVVYPLVKILLFWNSYKNRVYPLAKYCPVFFEHTIGEKKFVVFQTLEMVDFVNSLNKISVDKLIKESGLFIGHTYFSVPMDYHEGRLFTDEKNINEKVNQNFTYISEKIKENKIWNPTLLELVEHWKKFQNTKLELDPNNKIALASIDDLPYRFIK